MLVIGYIGPKLPGELRKKWNALFAKQAVDAFFDFYRTRQNDLPLRLSEMFLLERRGYIVDPSLVTAIVPLLDRLDASVQVCGAVNMVVNDGGVLTGHWIDAVDNSYDACLREWMAV